MVEETRKPKIYLATPFFNEPQKAGVKTLEELIEKVGYQLYSPSRDGKVCPPNATAELRKQTFDANAKNIDDCDAMVAWVDWLLPPGQHVRVLNGLQNEMDMQLPPQLSQLMEAGAKVMGVQLPPSGGAANAKKLIVTAGEVAAAESGPRSLHIGFQPPAALVQILTPPLNLPDSGTVWEMGYAFKCDIPIFTVSMITDKINLMLAESAVCHSTSEEQLTSRLTKFLPVATQPCTQEYVETLAALRLEGAFKGPVE